MRTNIDIDDDLMREAMQASGETTKRAAVERGLRLLIETRAQVGIRRLRGKVKWSGDQGTIDPGCGLGGAPGDVERVLADPRQPTWFPRRLHRRDERQRWR